MILKRSWVAILVYLGIVIAAEADGNDVVTAYERVQQLQTLSDLLQWAWIFIWVCILLHFGLLFGIYRQLRKIHRDLA